MEKPRFAAFDIDQTMYRWSLFLHQIDVMIEDGIMDPHIREEAQEARRLWENREGTYDAYLEAQVRTFCRWAMAGVSEMALMETSRKLLQRERGRQYLFTRELLKALGAMGYKTVAISGSLVQVVRLFAEDWGFDRWFGSEYEIGADGRFTGDDTKTVRHYLNKDVLFRRIMRELGCTEDASVGVGDTLIDLPMLKASCFPIAFNPDAALEEKARADGIPVVKERKSVITILQTGDPHFRSSIGSDGFVEKSACDVLPYDVGRNLQARLKRIGVHLR